MTDRALELSALYDSELHRLLPPGADIFDAHLHLGHDIDGMVGDDDQLEQVMARYGISRAFMFCLDEPDRHPGFRAANDRTLAELIRLAPRTIPELAEVPGIGPAKLERFGSELLAALADVA